MTAGRDASTSFHPDIKISDADFSSLPLGNFHIVIVVEPNPETWMEREEDWDNLKRLLTTYSQSIVDEIESEFNPSLVVVPFAEDVKDTWLMVVGEEEVPFYFPDVAESSDLTIAMDGDDFEKTRCFLRGVREEHPEWRVAVMGGVYEDEVVRVANMVKDIGLDTTVVKRYCISSEGFINLDDVVAAVMAERMRLREEGREKDEKHKGDGSGGNREGFI